MNKTRSKKALILSITIAIIFALFVGYGIEVFHDAPQREAFCGNNLYLQTSSESCQEAGGEWVEEGTTVPKPVDQETAGFCTEPRSCYEQFDLARSSHDQIVFIVSVIVGIIAIAAGVILANPAVSLGLQSGGVLLLLYGTIRYWQHANDVLKFVLLGVALAALIYLGYKKINK